jgi:hypothetical protein
MAGLIKIQVYKTLNSIELYEPFYKNAIKSTPWVFAEKCNNLWKFFVLRMGIKRQNQYPAAL